MYIARIQDKTARRYVLRESVNHNGTMVSRDLFDLGESPGQWIRYPGGNAFYLDEEMVYELLDTSDTFDADHLEDLFWPWVRPDIRRAVESFRNRSVNRSRPARLTDREKETILKTTQPFDMRRAHYLKFGNMDQGPIFDMPAVLFKGLRDKSRDEIEQEFLSQESRLKDRELKSYVYTIFDLQRFFRGFMAKKMPHALNQEKVETFFLDELCDINQRLFDRTDHLHPYMNRYLIMFFDHAYADTVLLEELKNDFIFRHRFFRQPPPRPTVSGKKARMVFNIDKQTMKTMSRRELTRRYRELARKHHPDKGGSHDAFVELNNAFQALLKKIR